MPILELNIASFRNIAEAKVEPHPAINLICGLNGSGKTSLLESIHFLGTGRSQRTNNLADVQQRDQILMRVSARISRSDQLVQRLSAARTRGQYRCTLNENPVSSRSELLRLLPVLSVSPESVSLIYDGPAQRRRFLDWGVFHVEPNFHSAWKRYHRAMSQRNALLRSGSVAGMSSWESEMSSSAEIIDTLRREHVAALASELTHFVHEHFSLANITVVYQRGWPEDRSLADTLSLSRGRDLTLYHSSQGPHRCDIKIRIGDASARAHLSRGQAKVVSSAMWFVHTAMVAAATRETPILLIDDIAAELDSRQGTAFFHAANSLGAQLFITTPLNHPPPINQEFTMFHVEQGCINRVEGGAEMIH